MASARLFGALFAVGVSAISSGAHADEPTWVTSPDDLAWASWSRPDDARRRADDERPEAPVRVRGRAGVGFGAGIYDAFGALGSVSAHVFVHPRVIVEGEFALATLQWSEHSATSSISGSLSWRVLLRDTFNLRLGVVAREVADGDGRYQSREEPQRDIGWIASLGNRWDARSFFIEADWIGVAFPVGSLSSTRSAASPELRIAHVTAGVAF